MGYKSGMQEMFVTTFLSRGRSVEECPGEARGATRNFLGSNDWSHFQLSTMQHHPPAPQHPRRLPAITERASLPAFTLTLPESLINQFLVSLCPRTLLWIQDTPLIYRRGMSSMVRSQYWKMWRFLCGGLNPAVLGHHLVFRTPPFLRIRGNVYLSRLSPTTGPDLL